ncbi:uroporphyrinogen-III synthase [Natribacillus halophilus]|uniref:Uroporphyrinogen-III synthase n=1 Tax=Natribacillus halophilus TaxID=549003 RepID=A0A1G8LSD9_9BACI|nr:uroporphyrinogen-III synthase [Natribacillus halophilus]SDI58543.1 uroporphyrinogen-III synthase [Natribacillus halophilus]
MSMDNPIALVTRAKADGVADPLVSQLQAFEVPVEHIPLVSQQILDNHGDIPAAKDVDWLVFTSANAIYYFASLLDTEEWIASSVRVAAVGPKTAEAASSAGFKVEVVPEEYYTGETLAHALGNAIRPEETIVIPKSKQARPYLPDFLREQGGHVIDPALYETVPRCDNTPELEKFLKDHPQTTLTFTSPSGVEAFKTMQPSGAAWPALCIGTVTADAALAAGFSQVKTASSYTFQALAELAANFHYGGE